MTSDDRTPRAATPNDDATRTPLAPSPDRGARATSGAGDAVAEPPRKQHGDALLDGSGSRQGREPDPARDGSPRE